jgi:hypothetical protein
LAIPIPIRFEEEYFSICDASFLCIWKIILVNRRFALMSFAPPSSPLRARKVLLVGSGPLAAAGLRRLLAAGASVRWFSHSLDVAEEIWLQDKADQIEIVFHPLRPSDLARADAIFAAVGEPLATQISEQARAAACPVCIVGRPELSTLIDSDWAAAGSAGDSGHREGAATSGSASRPSVFHRVVRWILARMRHSALTVGLSQPRSFGF